MKKVFLFTFLLIAIISIAIKTFAGCTSGSNLPYSGVCVPIFGDNGRVLYYDCASGETNAQKDCTSSPNSGGGDGDETLEPAS